MMLFSGYLMFIMATEFMIPNGWQAFCIYCVVSALFATTMFVLTVMGRAWEDKGQLLFSGFIVGFITLLATLLIFAPPASNAGDYQITDANGKVFFSVTESSSESQIALAKHLKATDAVMYGAHWCSHCFDQKNLFGVQALADMPYIECDPNGKDAKPDVCQAKFKEAEQQLKTQVGFPTWEIDGKFYSGTRPLQELAQFSGYDGPSDY